jgi:hypothetical protein
MTLQIRSPAEKLHPRRNANLVAKIGLFNSTQIIARKILPPSKGKTGIRFKAIIPKLKKIIKKAITLTNKLICEFHRK